MENIFPMVAKTFQGLEETLRDELIELGAENVELGQRMVTFEGDLAMMYKANLCCRTALRILKPIAKFTAADTDDLYDCVRDYDWESLMTPDSTFSIDSTVNSAEFTHSKFVTYRVKDGIVDHFNDKYGRRPSIRLNGADVQLNVHISDNRVTISLDSSGEPLSKRGYRVEQTEAPINEVLAAGIIMKTGWRGDCDFADPMCGSGTFLIEAALIAANINPGIYRKHFAFETWPDFDRELFEEIYNDDSGEREFAYKIFGGDIDPEAVNIAKRNIRSAHVEDMIEISCKSIADWEDLSPEGVMVSNPPYGERLKPDDIGNLYRTIGATLKREFKGWHAWIIGYKDEHFSAIGLKPSVKLPMHNGALECSLREYVMFEGGYNDFRAEGGSVKNSSIRFEEKPKKKFHRMSDDEWESETRKFKGKRDDRKRDDRRRDDRKFDDRKFDDRRRDNRGREESRFSDRKRDDRKFDDRRRDDRKFNDRKFDDRRRDDRKFNDRKRDDRHREPLRISNRGPRLPEESATVISPLPIRKRKGWYRNSDQEQE